ncbi:MAG TPA: hypothetical protein VKV39_17070 [Candidatus Sulfotelmatobacter sp.]|nr:hypothetical protein [Candidatus Sulfotelmatobacter sp.]
MNNTDLIVRRPSEVLPPEDAAHLSSNRPRSGSLLGYYRDAVKERIRLEIDRKTTAVATATLRVQTEHLKVWAEHQNMLRASQLAGMEGALRAAELHKRMEDIAREQQLNRQLSQSRLERDQLALQKEKLALRVDIARLEHEMRMAGVPPAVPPTPAQERATKKAELERQLEELGAEEARTVNRAASDAERRRIQNMFANRREQLMEELEDIL